MVHYTLRIGGVSGINIAGYFGVFVYTLLDSEHSAISSMTSSTPKRSYASVVAGVKANETLDLPGLDSQAGEDKPRAGGTKAGGAKASNGKTASKPRPRAKARVAATGAVATAAASNLVAGSSETGVQEVEASPALIRA